MPSTAKEPGTTCVKCTMSANISVVCCRWASFSAREAFLDFCARLEHRIMKDGAEAQTSLPESLA